MENNPLVNSKILFVSDEELALELQRDLDELGFELRFHRNVTPTDLKLKEQFPTLASSLSWIELKNKNLTLFMKSGLSLQIDLMDKKYHRKFSPSKDLLCRACGWHLGFRTVWDLTAGLLVDTSMLAKAGFIVTAIERNPSIVLLLREALRKYRVAMNEIRESEKKSRDLESLGEPTLNFNKISVVWSDSESFISKISPEGSLPDVIYYDPMYPAKNKTALPSKEMQILRELNGINEESPELLKKVLQLKVKRVVVKRPLKANEILENPKFHLKSKLVRYDIY